MIRLSGENEQKRYSPYDSFFSILRNNDHLEEDYNDFQNLVNSGLTTEQAVAKLRMDRIPPTSAEKYRFCKAFESVITCRISQFF